MKITKVIKNPDYVRFNIDIEMEQEGLKVISTICGGLIEKDFNGVTLQLFEDPECDFEFYLFNKKTSYLGFKDLYTKLFNADFCDFTEELHEISMRELYKNYKYSPANTSNRDKLIAIKANLLDCPKVVSRDGDVYYTRTYYISDILRSIYSKNSAVAFKDESGISYYGIKVEEVNDFIQRLKDLTLQD